MTFDRALSFCCHFVIIGLIEHIYGRNFILDQLLCQLNQAQLEAVTSTEGFIRVIAGAGSGKTRALSHRFAFLVNEIGILPGNILCVTFTNKAANEMRHRIHNLIAILVILIPSMDFVYPFYRKTPMPYNIQRIFLF